MTECIEWTGLVGNTGYGRMYIPSSGYGAGDERVVLAHRHAWEQTRGPIPDGLTVHHVCENRLCINVDHMQLLDRHHHAGGGGHGKLNREKAERIKALLHAGHRGMDVAEWFGVSRQQVCNIKKGRCWA